MKKVITLLLALTMVCAFLPIMASAADVNYDFSISTYNDDIGDNYWEEEGIFGLTIKSVGAKFSSGSIAIKYDATKVKLVRDNGRDVSSDNYDITKYFDNIFVGGSVATGQAGFNSLDKGYIVMNISRNATSYPIESATTNEVLGTLGFMPIDDVTTPENCEGVFDLIPADDQYLVDCQVKTNGGALVFKDSNSTVYSSDAGTAGATGVITTETADAWAAQDSAPASWTNPATEGKTNVIVFGKSVDANGTALSNYSVTFGDNTYYGSATAEDTVAKYWAIVLVDDSADNSLIGVGKEYTGTVNCDGVTWTVETGKIEAGKSHIATKVAE